MNDDLHSLPSLAVSLPSSLRRGVSERLTQLQAIRFGARLWQKDPSLWSESAKEQAMIRSSLGWLDAPRKVRERLDETERFRADLVRSGIRRVVHMGMGGSSLAPLALQHLYPPSGGGLALEVLDTTDPATVLRIRDSAPLVETLFVVASKSGTTAEPLAFEEYFYHELTATLGNKAGEHLAAITDPGSQLQRHAAERGYRALFLNDADIGGRYSALSYFGLVPVGFLGIDLHAYLARALDMVTACGPDAPEPDNPGIVLGATLGELGLRGRDKVTLVLSPSLTTLGMWIEQLLAESTGKEDKGLLPVAGEPLGDPSQYGEDRVFVVIGLEGEPDAPTERRLAALARAGQPVIRLQMQDRLDLGREFFRWEVATATAGAILGINPFDQPNVAESKANTNRLLEIVRAQGELSDEAPTAAAGPLSLYGGEPGASVAEVLQSLFATARLGDYVAVLAYLTEEPGIEQALQALRLCLRGSLSLATTVGYGPRYLHSTGQYHKGGPDTGLFLLLTADDPTDAEIPGQPYSFGVFRRAQALGDVEALRGHGRRVLRAHLGANAAQGLEALAREVEAATHRVGS